MRIRIGIGILSAALAIGGLSGQSMANQHELGLSSGITWRGDDGDKVKIVYKNDRGVQQEMIGVIVEVNARRPGFEFIKVRGDVAGRESVQGIFVPDIISMDTVAGGSENSKSNVVPGKAGVNAPKGTKKAKPQAGDADPTSRKSGVFFMPWSGMVGVEARHDEIEKIAKEADKYGDGQTIVIQIKSGGGLVLEGDRIHETLKDVKKRHRVVAWIKEAISAAAFTALHCDEIYFMKNGAMGSAVMFAGQTSISGAELEAWVQKFGDVAEIGGRDPIPAYCMVTRTRQASYDKDEETGKITWYPDMRGEYDLSDGANVLTLNAKNALDCGYANGIAETKEELAKLLDMDEWIEVNQNGQRIHDRWQKTVADAREELPKLFARMEYKGTASGDPLVALQTRISLLQRVLYWYDRCYPVCVYEVGLPQDPEPLKRQLSELKKQLADARRGNRR